MEWFLLPVLFGASAFFSAAETALFAVRRVDLARLRERGDRTAGAIERMLENPRRIIATIFVGTELVNIAISAILAALLVPRFPPHGEILAFAAGTLGILILGDVTPKSIVWPRALPFALRAAGPLNLFARIVAPLRLLFEKATEAILRLAGGTDEAPAGFSEREFRALVDASEESGTLDAGEKELIHNIFEMTDKRAGEIMTPLADVFMVATSTPYAALLDAFRRFRRSRVPVYESERGNVVGILYFKDLLRPLSDGAGEVAWTGLVKPPFVIPTAKKLPLLLREFQRLKVHLAIVVDEFGGTAGIVTLEDVLEELFGEIREEHDREEEEITRRPDGSFRVLGKTAIRRFNEAFDALLSDEEWDTVAGLLLHEFGRLPGKGDSLVLGPFRFTVERVKGIRIVEVAVQRLHRGGG